MILLPICPFPHSSIYLFVHYKSPEKGLIAADNFHQESRQRWKLRWALGWVQRPLGLGHGTGHLSHTRGHTGRQGIVL